MKVLKNILYSLLVLALILGGVSLLLPSEVNVERTALIDAPTTTVFKQVNNLKNWKSWSPWFKKDPAVKLTYEGPTEGKDAKYSWESKHEEVGNGTLTIMESEANKSIQTNIDFGGQGSGNGNWSFEQTPEGTKVTWGLTANMGMNPIAKYMGLMMDKQVGPSFEEGLANLKEISQQQAELDKKAAEEAAKMAEAAAAEAAIDSTATADADADTGLE